MHVRIVHHSSPQLCIGSMASSAFQQLLHGVNYFKVTYVYAKYAMHSALLSLLGIVGWNLQVTFIIILLW